MVQLVYALSIKKSANIFEMVPGINEVTIIIDRNMHISFYLAP